MGRKRKRLNAENGYLLVSTLFFLVFSGLFLSSMIRISGSQVIQMNQVSASYQARTGLNMAKEQLQQQFREQSFPKKGLVKTSLGQIVITRTETEDHYTYLLTLETTTGVEYSDQLFFKRTDLELEEERLDGEDLI